MPDEKELERRHKEAAAEMLGVLFDRGRHLIEHEVKIAMGEAVGPDGETPDFSTQANALKSLRQQILGNPLQRIEQHTRSTKVTAHFELPSEKLPAAIDVPLLPPPSPLALPPDERKIPVLEPVKATGRQILSQPRSYYAGDGTDKTWQQAVDPTYVPPVYPDEDPTYMSKKP